MSDNLPTISGGKVQVPTLPQSIDIDAGWYSQRDKILSEAQKKAPTVSGQEEWDAAEWYLKKVTKSVTDLEKKRKELAKPFRETDKAIKKLADEAAKPLIEEKARLKKLMQDRMSQIEHEREVARQEAAKRAEEADNPFDEVLEREAPPAEVEEPDRTMTSVRKVTKFRITNSNNVPREYCSPDERLIRQAVKDGITDIPGVETWEQNEVRSR